MSANILNTGRYKTEDIKYWSYKQRYLCYTISFLM